MVASEEFARDMGWMNNGAVLEERLVEAPKRLGAPVVTVTLGNRGGLTAGKGGLIRTPAFEVAALDTTGAGDVFHGGYI